MSDTKRHFPTEPVGFCRRWPHQDSPEYRKSLGSTVAPWFTAVGRAGQFGASMLGLFVVLSVAVPWLDRWFG